MRVIANRQLTGHYGVVSMGQEFDADEDVARQLLRAGLVMRPTRRWPASHPRRFSSAVMRGRP
jgi:hypothetical protein